MNRRILTAVLSVAAALASSGDAFALTPSTGDIVLGEWNANFSQGKKFAEQYHVPMVLFYASPTCPNCATLKAAIDTREFEAWMDRRQMVMILDTGGEAAHAFAYNESGMLPYICVYWPKADGSRVEQRFSGLNGRMEPVKTGTLAEQFMGSCDYWTKDYEGVYRYAEFKVAAKSEGDRLEAVAGKTTYVDVPLVRSEVYAQDAASNLLIARFPNGVAVTNGLAWAAGQSELLSRVEFPKDYASKVDDRIVLELAAEGVTETRTSALTVVEDPANSSRNPLWLNDAFAFGQFTFDYDAATNAVAQKRAAGEKAYVIALYTGALWCPYCKGIEESLLADTRFYDWAEANNVALVEFDQGRASTPSTAAGTRAPRLLTFEPDPKLSLNATVSGAGYRSRHSVEDDDAERILARTTHYTQAWLAPESTAARLSQPTLLLIEDDRVQARFAARRDNAKVYDTVENLGRLDDFLKLSDGPGEMDSYRTTSALRHTVGAAETATLQISDRTRFYALDEVAAGRLEFFRGLGCAKDLVFTLMQGSKTLATGTNELSYDVSSETAKAGGLTLKLGAYANTSKLFFNCGTPVETTVFTAAFSSQLVLIPEERRSVCPRAGELCVELKAGVVYRFRDFAPGSFTGLTAVDAVRGIYRATADEVRTMTANSAAAVYQIWKPGVFAFVETDLAIDEGEGCVLSVERRDGGSDAAKIAVKLDEVASVLVAPERYMWTDTVLEWADGETGVKTVGLVTVADYVADGDQALHFQLEEAEGEDLTLEDDRCAVTILDDAEIAAGKFAFGETSPLATRNTVIVGSDGRLDVSVLRLNGAELAAGVTVALSDGSLPPVRITWRSNERAFEKTVSFDLSRRPSGSAAEFTLQLTQASLPVKPGAGSLKVKVFDASAPRFAAEEATFCFSRGVQGSNAVALENVGPGVIGFDKVSGTLAPGLFVATDGLAGSFVIVGAPTCAGTSTCVYRVWEEREGVRVYGNTVAVTISVGDPIAEKKTAPSVSAAGGFTLEGIPVYDQSLVRLAGILTVSVRSSGVLSAKYRCAAGTKSMTASSWESYDEKTGALTASLSSRDNLYRMTLAVAADGAVSGTLVDQDFVYDQLSFGVSGEVWSKKNPAADYEGRYTLAFAEPTRLTGNEGVAATGLPTFACKIQGSALKAGRMAYVGRLPNGRQVSGSAVLVARKDAQGKAFAVLPIYFQSGADVFAAVADVTPGAKAAYEAAVTEEEHETVHRAMATSGEAISAWSHVEKKTENGSFTMQYGAAYGAYYDPDEPFNLCLGQTDVGATVNFSVAMSNLVVSSQYGEPGEFAPVPVSVGKKDLTVDSTVLNLHFARAQGLVSGTVKLPFAARTVMASFSGVLLPGWTGCGCTEGKIDLPFLMGACWFSDKFYYSSEEGCTESGVVDSVMSVKKGCGFTGETTAK